MKNVADIYALSPMQQLMLLHAKTAVSTNDVLASQIVYRLDGALSEDAYRQAWQHVVDRHPALRTLFVWQDGKDPVQVVRERVTLPWASHDWRDQTAAEQAQKLADLLRQDRAEGFDLLRAPLMRVLLIRLADDAYWLVWSSYHLVLDRWCIDIVLDDAAAAYDAFTGGTHPVLPPAPRYRDYIGWLQVQDENAAAAYWRDALGGLDTRPLPLQPASQDAVTLSTKRFDLPDEDVARLNQFARDHGLTLSTLMSAAWAVVVGAATGVDDVVFGQTVSGRPADLPRVAGMVGSFINNVPLRLTLTSAAPLRDWLHSVQDRQLGLQPFDYASPAQIRAWADLRTAGPLFDSLIVMQAPIRIAQPGGLAVRYEQGELQTGYPVSLDAELSADRMTVTLIVENGRVPDRLAHWMNTSLARALRALPEHASGTLADLRAEIEPVVAEQTLAATNGAKRAGETRPYVAPVTGVGMQLAAIWQDLLGVPQVGIYDNFFDLGGDSISATQLFTLIEEQFDRRLPLSLIFQAPTVGQLAEKLYADSDEPQDAVLVPVRPQGSRPPFFFVHGVFGDVLALVNVSHTMDPDQPLYGLQAIGLQHGREPDTDLEAMAARYVEAIRRVQPEGPYHLGGFCFGGLVAYEMARQLESLGEETALLAMIEGAAPPQFHRKAPVYDAARLRVLYESAAHFASGYDEFGGWRLMQRMGKRFGRSGAARNGHAHGRVTDADENDNTADFNALRPEVQHQLRPINIAAVNAYVPPPYGGTVTLFRARFLPIGQALAGSIDPQKGWGTLTNGRVQIRYVDGGHISMLVPPHAAGLGAELSAALREAQRVGF